MGLVLSDELLGAFAPILVYWVYSRNYVALSSLENYRLHSKVEEEEKNLVSKSNVVKGVLLQQFIQAIVTILLFTVTGSDAESSTGQQFSLWLLPSQCVTAMLVVPYAYGALYNHPLEGLLLDTIGGALSFLISGMSPKTSIFFFSFATIKTVDDHCGLCLPGYLFHILFKNNTAYHDVHHQLYGNKFNFSQPFFVMWDRILGTYMPYSLEKRKDSGYEARPTKQVKD